MEDTPEIRQALARAAVEEMQTQGASPPLVINALCEALGMMLATVSPDMGSLVKNAETFGAQVERFAGHYLAVRAQLEAKGELTDGD